MHLFDIMYYVLMKINKILETVLSLRNAGLYNLKSVLKIVRDFFLCVSLEFFRNCTLISQLTIFTSDITVTPHDYSFNHSLIFEELFIIFIMMVHGLYKNCWQAWSIRSCFMQLRSWPMPCKTMLSRRSCSRRRDLSR